MIRRILGLLLLFLILIVNPALARSETVADITPMSLNQGDKIAQKALKAIQKGDYVGAETYWTQLIEQFPNNPAVWSNRGNTRISQYKLDEAIADFDRSIELLPDAPDAYLNRGIAYEGKQLWQDALADYNRVLELNPQDAVAYNNRGNAKAGQGRWQEALADYTKATEIEPQFAMARGNVALAMYQLGQKQQAIQTMRNLVRKYPMFADMRAALTAALWIDGQQGEAESNWVATVGLDRRYQDLNWVKNIRRWPPQMVNALEKFLTLN